MDQRRRIRDAYDEIAADYDDQRTALTKGLLDGLSDRLAPDSRVLDAGCGPGRGGLEGLDAHHRTVGLDFSREQLRLAVDAGRGDRVIAGDMTRLPFVDSAFDAVTSFYAVIHVPTGEHSAVLGEFARVCRAGGWLLFTAGDEAWSGANDDWLGTGVGMEWSFPDRETTITVLTEVGFDVVSVRDVNDELGGSFPLILAQRTVK